MSDISEAIDGAIREALAAAFHGRPTLRFEETAKVLRMDPKTLRRHVADGRISYRVTGTGSARKRREFSLTDLERFYEGRTERNAKRAAGSVAPPRKVKAVGGIMGFTDFLAHEERIGAVSLPRNRSSKPCH
ncbi:MULTISPECIES: helix-turn-helix domain-containing protein [unclassified Bradyrhizobium]|uniref:helix-turn-helix domain-containing protein n=1 Tax=unclassified Bradyrhizobium TaxID=2631580 RepID=UPI002FF1CBA2